MEIIGLICFFGIPAALFAGFVVSIVKFRKCPAELPAERKKWRTAMIVTGTVSLVFITVIIGLIALLALAIANM